MITANYNPASLRMARDACSTNTAISPIGVSQTGLGGLVITTDDAFGPSTTLVDLLSTSGEVNSSPSYLCYFHIYFYLNFQSFRGPFVRLSLRLPVRQLWFTTLSSYLAVVLWCCLRHRVLQLRLQIPLVGISFHP